MQLGEVEVANDSDEEVEDLECKFASSHGFFFLTSSTVAKPKQPVAHRIAATGSRVPRSTSDFITLQARYGVQPLLLENLAKSGFTQPTAIQSQAIPILLEVCVVW